MITNDIPQPTTQMCWRCKSTKILSDFHKSKSEQFGHARVCKICVAKHRKLNPEKYRKYKHDTHIRNTYGVGPTEYEAMLNVAGHKCQICGTDKPGMTKRNFCVDHDHRTGTIRGLLCNRCNRALGLLGDQISVLNAAISYLRFHDHQR